jgi:phenylacetate-CoA ligase
MYLRLIRFYRYIKKCEKMEPRRLREINFHRIRDLALYAYRNVDYYRELYDSKGFDPATMKSEEDLAGLPVVEKDHFRHTPPAKRTSREFTGGRTVEMTTSGSTGQPLIFFSNRLEMSKQTLKWLYVLMKYGYRPTDNLVQLFRPLASANRNIVQRFGIFRRNIISIFDPMDKIMEDFTKSRIDVLSGLKSSLLICGEELEKRGIEIRPKFLATTGEVLTENDRKLLRRYYSAGTVDIYASAETGNIAYTCPACDYMHVHGESIFINRFMSEEKVYITNLEQRVTPILNYNLGDRIVHFDDHDCGCGSRLPLIKAVTGREDDIVISTSGRKFNTQYLWAKLKFMEDDIDQYKIVQKTDMSVVIKLKINKGIDIEGLSAREKTIIQNFSEVADPGMLRVEFVDGFPVEGSGKFRVVDNEYIRHKKD